MTDDRRSGRLEIVLVVVLSIAGLASSWASYQSSLWDGNQATSYSRANELRVAASRAALDASVTRAVEISLFASWLEATARGDAETANFYRARFPPTLEPAFAEWLSQKPMQNPDAAASPFALRSYKRPGIEEAAAVEARAEAEFAQGVRANDLSDNFNRGSVILATAMFFAGVGQVFTGRGVRLTLATISIASCALGLLRVLTLPILGLG